MGNKNGLTEEQLEYIKNNYPAKTIHTIKNDIDKPWLTVKNALESMGIDVNIEPAWPDEEIELLRKLANTDKIEDIAKKLNKTNNAVYLKAKRLGIVLAKSPRTWAKEDKQYLKENWGQISTDTIAKKLKRKHTAIMQQAHKMKLGSLYKITDNISLSDFCAYTGISRDRITRTLINQGFPLETQRLTPKRKIYTINIEKVLEWMEKHQDLFDGSKVSEDLFIPEPKWLKEKRRNDRTNKVNINYQVKKTQWTENDISLAISLLTMGYTQDKIAERLNRSKLAVQVMLSKHDQAYKEKRFWSGKEFKYIREHYKTQSDKEMALALNRSEKAVQYQRLNLGLRKRKQRRD